MCELYFVLKVKGEIVPYVTERKDSCIDAFILLCAMLLAYKSKPIFLSSVFHSHLW